MAIKATTLKEVDLRIKIQRIKSLIPFNDIDYDDVGWCHGDKCNRNGCDGLIQKHEEYVCSCHTGNPPCSSCVDGKHYCLLCEWDEHEEWEVDLDRVNEIARTLEDKKLFSVEDINYLNSLWQKISLTSSFLLCILTHNKKG